MGKIFWIIVAFVLVGGWIIYSSYSIDLDDKADRMTFVKKMGGWLFGVGKNLKDLTGYMIKQQWLPERPGEANETIQVRYGTTTIIIDE
ncbi:hypothetical protein JXB02_04295 [Candidatus Woesearchaeota archaeon]|nr:hypothetical protein [Candidatus Woesearchaeota archaeon]